MASSDVPLLFYLHMYTNSMDKIVTILANFINTNLSITPLLALLGAINKVQDQTS